MMSIQKIILSCLVVLGSCFFSFSQNASSLVGYVKDEKNNPVKDAYIILENSIYKAISNDEGYYNLPNLPVGKYLLKVSSIGFAPYMRNIEISNTSENLNIVLVNNEESLNDVTVIGMTEAEKTNRQAYNVTAIDAKKLYNTTLDIADALDRTAGVRVRESGGLGSNMNFSINGFSGRQVKIFLDGMPMDNFGPSFQLNNIPVNIADRIEVYRGVVPIWLGSDALGGAVNIVTASKRKNFVDLSYSYGSFNTHKTVLSGAYTTKKGFITQLNLYQNYSDNNYWINVDVADLNTGQYFPNERLRRFHDKYHNETALFQTGIVEKKWADEFLVGVTLGKSYADVQTGARMVSVFGQWHRKSNLLMPTFKYSKNNFIIQGLNVRLSGNYNLGYEQNIDTAYRRYNWFGDYKQYEGKGGERSLSMYKYNNNNGIAVANVDYRINDQHSISLNNVFNTFNRKGSDELFPNENRFDFPRITRKNITGLGYIYNNEDKFTSNIFIKNYSQYNKKALGFEENGTTVYRNVSQNVAVQGYGAAMSYYLTDDLQIKASYEKSYRMPEPDELFGDNVNLEGNPNLKPEKSNNYNLGFNYNKLIQTKNYLSATTNLIYRDSKDFIRTQLNRNQAMLTNDNLASVTNLGVEADVNYNINNRYIFGVNATYQNIRNNTQYEDGYTVESPTYRDRMPNIPYLFGNANASVNFPDVFLEKDRFSVSYNLLFVNKYYLYWPSMGSDKLDIPTQISNDISLLYAANDGKYNISLECKNLLDAKIYDNFSLQKPGRAFYVKLRYYLNNFNNKQ